MIAKRRTNAAVPVALLVPPDPPRDDGAGAVPQHPVAPAADRGELEVAELDDRLAPVGMIPTDPAWMRLMELLSFRPGRWWNTIFGIVDGGDGLHVGPGMARVRDRQAPPLLPLHLVTPEQGEVHAFPAVHGQEGWRQSLRHDVRGQAGQRRDQQG